MVATKRKIQQTTTATHTHTHTQ